MIKWFIINFLFLSSVLAQSPREIAVGLLPTLLNGVLQDNLEELEKRISTVPDNKKRIHSKFILLNLKGYNFDVTLVKNKKEIASVSVLFLEGKKNLYIYKKLKPLAQAQRVIKEISIKDGPHPGSFIDFDFKNEKTTYRFEKTTNSLFSLTLKK
jgi:hypothetical protein